MIVEYLNEQYLSVKILADKNKFYEVLEKVKSINGRVFEPKTKIWKVPNNSRVIESLKKYGFRIGKGIKITKEKIIVPKIDRTIFKDLPLYNFQLDGIEQIEKLNGRALLADEMGLGKTIQSLMYLKLHPEKIPALIICPASLKLNWKKEIKRWINQEAFCIYGNAQLNLLLKWNIFIINYDIIKSHLEWIKEQNFKIIIVDECHYAKNEKAMRAKATKMACKNIKHIIAMSGTPITNKPIEMFTALNILDPVTWNSRWRFANRYCNPTYNGFGWSFDGATHTDELHEILSSTIMIRRLKKDVLKDLPAKQQNIILFEINNRKDYDKGIITFKESPSGPAVNILAEIEKLKQIAVYGKMESVFEWIDNFIESGNKLVLFAVHHFIIDMLKEKYNNISVVVDGRTNQAQRQKNVESFQNNEAIKLFIGNIKAAGVGITLTAASDVAFIEFPWTPGELTQAEDRIHRIGQEAESINCWYLIADDTIESDIADLLDHKKKVLDAIIDGKNTDEESLLSELIKKIKGRKI